MNRRVSVVITDLDNTLFDWFEIWHSSFRALLDGLVSATGIAEEILIADFKKIHEKYGTSEYAFSVQELACLRAKYPDEDLKQKFLPAIEAFRRERDRALQLYPTVLETLEQLKDKKCLIVGYTDSLSYYSKFRVRRLGLDRVLDYLYSPPDHSLPPGRNPTVIEMRRTVLRGVPADEAKPNPKVLTDILMGVGADRSETIYIGNSRMKDIAMAQDAGVTDVHAAYGENYPQEKYELLRAVTHWKKKDVETERHLKPEQVIPTYTASKKFAEILDMFEFVEFRDRSPQRMSIAVDVWKKTVDVQQHFNDLELRIRNYAVTVLAAMLGLAAYAFKANLYMPVYGWRVSAAAAIAVAAIVPWSAFYMMDRYWYHLLLYGAVHHGLKIERRWEMVLPELKLTDSIGEHSPVKFLGVVFHSKHKMTIFYLAGIVLLLLAGLFAQVSRSNEPTPKPDSAATPHFQQS